MTDPAWTRLGELLVSRRVDLGYPRRLTWARDVLGLSNDRIQSDLENGRRTNYDAATLSLVEQQYQWAPGSIRKVLDGGEPTPIEDIMPRQPNAALTKEPVRLDLDEADPEVLEWQLREVKKNIITLQHDIERTQAELDFARVRQDALFVERGRIEQALARKTQSETPDWLTVDALVPLLIGAKPALRSNPPGDAPYDIAAKTPGGDLLLIQIKSHSTDIGQARDQLTSYVMQQHAAEPVGVHGLLLVVPDEATALDRVRAYLANHEPLRTPVTQAVAISATDGYVSESSSHLAPVKLSARDIGKPSLGQQKRDAANQAGEPPADDADDMEPR